MKLILPDKFASLAPLARLRWAAVAQELCIRRFNAGDEMEQGLGLAKRRIWEPRFALVGAELAQARRELWAAGTPEQRGHPFWVPGDRHVVRGNATALELSRLGDLRDLFPGGVDAAGLPDPLQDLSTYTELDADGRISHDGTTATVTGMGIAVDDRLHIDAGAGHFTTAWTHHFITSVTAGSGNAYVYAWAVSNYVDDGNDWQVNTRQAVGWFWYRESGTTYSILRDNENGAGDQDLFTQASMEGKNWYPSIVRSGAGGTSCQCLLYSNSGRTTLVDTATVTLASGRTYQYYFAVNSFNLTPSNVMSMTSGSHDWNEVAGQPAIKRFGGIPFVRSGGCQGVQIW